MIVALSSSIILLAFSNASIWGSVNLKSEASGSSLNLSTIVCKVSSIPEKSTPKLSAAAFNNLKVGLFILDTFSGSLDRTSYCLFYLISSIVASNTCLVESITESISFYISDSL